MAAAEIVLIAIGILTFVLAMIQGGLVPFAHGLRYGLGSRNEPRTPTVFMQRVQRVMDNHLQSCAMALPILVVLAIHPQDAGTLATQGAYLYLAARVVYSALYLAGVPYLRSLAWGIAMTGLMMMLTSWS